MLLQDLLHAFQILFPAQLNPLEDLPAEILFQKCFRQRVMIQVHLRLRGGILRHLPQRQEGRCRHTAGNDQKLPGSMGFLRSTRLPCSMHLPGRQQFFSTQQAAVIWAGNAPDTFFRQFL